MNKFSGHKISFNNNIPVFRTSQDACWTLRTFNNLIKPKSIVELIKRKVIQFEGMLANKAPSVSTISVNMCKFKQGTIFSPVNFYEVKDRLFNYYNDHMQGIKCSFSPNEEIISCSIGAKKDVQEYNNDSLNYNLNLIALIKKFYDKEKDIPHIIFDDFFNKDK